MWDTSNVILDPVEWRNTRPTKRMGSGLLIRNPEGAVLIVEPSYKETWEIPGGSVEKDESPRSACHREAFEELGIEMNIGRLLCLEWQGPEPERTESLMFIYDGGLVADSSHFNLASEELLSCRFVKSSDFDEHLAPRLSRRLRAALSALKSGFVVELEHGTEWIG
jgi:8-oxo-dGTP diphosphatase